MSFLDKAKSKASQLTSQAKEKFDDLKEKREVDNLLDDLGRIVYRQHTGRSTEADNQEIEVIVRKLQAMEAEGADVLTKTQPAAPAGTDTPAPEAATPAPAGNDMPPPPAGSMPTMPSTPEAPGTPIV